MALECIHPSKAPYGYIRNIEYLKSQNTTLKKYVSESDKDNAS